MPSVERWRMNTGAYVTQSIDNTALPFSLTTRVKEANPVKALAIYSNFSNSLTKFIASFLILTFYNKSVIKMNWIIQKSKYPEISVSWNTVHLHFAGCPLIYISTNRNVYIILHTCMESCHPWSYMKGNFFLGVSNPSLPVSRVTSSHNLSSMPHSHV